MSASSARAVVLALASLGASCRGEAEGPARVVWDRDTCRGCSMVLSDRSFAAQVRTPQGRVEKFDDIGCAARWLDQQPFAQDPSVQVWVSRQKDGAWLDARTAHFVAGQRSPMGFDHGAVDGTEPGLTFEELRQQLRAARPSMSHGAH